MTKENIEEFLYFYDIHDIAYKEKCYNCYEIMISDKNMKNKFYPIKKMLIKNKNCEIEKIWKIKHINELFEKEVPPFITNLLLLSNCKEHKENMKKYGFKEEQINIHKTRVRECLTKDIYNRGYNGIRVSQMLWGMYFVNCKLIEVGRLQYEYCNENNYKFIKIHIPSGEKLLYEKVIDSLEHSKDEIKKYFNLENNEYYCESWLLSNEIKNILDKNSNIYKFRELFEVKDGKNANEDILNFVYGLQNIKNFKELPENTSLQRNIKELLLKEKDIYIGIGKLKNI